MSLRVAGLYAYPIKSCAGFALDRALLDARGIQQDRRLMLVDQQGSFLTQRNHPRMALIVPQLHEQGVSLAAPGQPTLFVPYCTSGPRVRVQVWSDRCRAVDQGAAAAAWLSSFLETPCRLVRMADEHVRRVDGRYARSRHDQVSFADGYPLLLTSEASLADLNARLEQPLPMNRFRPNLVVSGCEPYAEDSWKTIQVGQVLLSLVKPCVRCVITTTDQRTAERGKEPLRTLSTYRRLPRRGPTFGQNLVHHSSGELRVGDEITVLERR